MTCEELEFEWDFGVGIRRAWEDLGRLGGGSIVNRGREVEIHYGVEILGMDAVRYPGCRSKNAEML